MTAETATVAMIGMPASGKSTFLAALYQGLTDPPEGTQARLASQPGQRAYLEELRQAWLSGDPVGRTLPDSGEVIELDILYGSRRVALTVPDVAGESFSGIFAKRQADARVQALVRDADGLLLFTHPDHQRPRVRIAEANAMRRLIGEEQHVSEDRDFDPTQVPGEVQLVDLLQWASDVRVDRPGSAPCRVALVISAWDRAGDRTPEQWLATKMPLLGQFLAAQDNRFNVRLYGISAQGGDYMTDDLADRRPAERPRVVSMSGVESRDLSEPLRWAALG